MKTRLVQFTIVATALACLGGLLAEEERLLRSCFLEHGPASAWKSVAGIRWVRFAEVCMGGMALCLLIVPLSRRSLGRFLFLGLGFAAGLSTAMAFALRGPIAGPGETLSFEAPATALGQLILAGLTPVALWLAWDERQETGHTTSLQDTHRGFRPEFFEHEPPQPA